VFAFEKSARDLRRAGLEFEYANWPLYYGRLRQYLSDQPSGTVVALAIPAMQLGAALQHDAAPLEAIGGRAANTDWSNLAAIGVVGRRGALQSQDRDHALVFAPHAAAIGTTGTPPPVDIFAEATYDSAAIRVGSREIIRSGEAPVVAVWDRRGTLLHAFALRPDGDVPMASGPLNIRRSARRA
jgi:hypothetical protein